MLATAKKIPRFLLSGNKKNINLDLALTLVTEGENGSEEEKMKEARELLPKLIWLHSQTKASADIRAKNRLNARLHLLGMTNNGAPVMDLSSVQPLWLHKEPNPHLFKKLWQACYHMLPRGLFLDNSYEKLQVREWETARLRDQMGNVEHQDKDGKIPSASKNGTRGAQCGGFISLYGFRSAQATKKQIDPPVSLRTSLHKNMHWTFLSNTQVADDKRKHRGKQMQEWDLNMQMSYKGDQLCTLVHGTEKHVEVSQFLAFHQFTSSEQLGTFVLSVTDPSSVPPKVCSPSPDLDEDEDDDDGDGDGEPDANASGQLNSLESLKMCLARQRKQIVLKDRKIEELKKKLRKEKEERRKGLMSLVSRGSVKDSSSTDDEDEQKKARKILFNQVSETVAQFVGILMHVSGHI